MAIIIFLLFLIGFFCIVVFINAINYLFYNKDPDHKRMQFGAEITIIVIAPVLFVITSDYGLSNDCCSFSAFFSPAHRLTIYALIVASMVCYFVASRNSRPLPPLSELLINIMMVVAIILNVTIAIHFSEIWSVFIIGILILLFIQQLVRRYRILSNSLSKMDNRNWMYSVVLASWFKRYPLLLILCIPVLSVFIALLYLFGQKPDSIVKAFTETFHLGFSQWDYMCDNVSCGGHYLCSVAANGHKNWVKPLRYGKRHGNLIICNRHPTGIPRK